MSPVHGSAPPGALVRSPDEPGRIPGCTRRPPEDDPCVGPITASAIFASIGDGHQFSNGRSFAAWFGLTPLNQSSGGKERLGRISKMGDRYIRRLLVLGMTSRIKQIRQRPDQFDSWFYGILEREPPKLAAVAMANKTARIIWAVLTREQDYRIRAIQRREKTNQTARRRK